MKLFTCCLLLPFAVVVTAPIRAQRENLLLNDALGTTTEKTIPATTIDAFKDPDSQDIMITKVVEKDQAPSRRKTGVEKVNMGLMDVSSRLVRDQGSRKLLNGTEGMTADSQVAENLSGKQVIGLNGDHVSDSGSLGTNLQRRATPGRVNGMPAPGPSRKQLDWDSLEENNGNPAPVGNRGYTDHDETREFISAEMYPTGAVAPPEHMPSSLSVPAKSRAA
ncbi:uncharacterized protein LOC127366571 isoform X2 [Dicentrarchus labrax]|uniref:uncharacterized protein LOC127366571 isoform X2 n=1 Tax=Dicentrarchus labrax TaxID=13489 RepID=UPI0021F52A8B|nr:uncharacterized protein LOC127366571 isoform X2 [Dicentrarchus labrax]